MHSHRSTVVTVVALALLCACGGQTDSGVDASINDAGGDAAADRKACLPDGTKVTVSTAANCCSGVAGGSSGGALYCEAHCNEKGSGCMLPDQPCCADSGTTCINGGCQ